MVRNNAACLLTCIDAKLLQLVNGLKVFDLFCVLLLFPALFLSAVRDQ